MKITIYDIMFILILISMPCMGATSSWPQENYDTDNWGRLYGSSIADNFQMIKNISCSSVYQPLIYDIDSDDKQEIILWCNDRIKIYSNDGTLLKEEITGEIKGNPAIDPLNNQIVAVIGTNLTKYIFDGSILTKTFSENNNYWGGGESVMCSGDCFSSKSGFVVSTGLYGNNDDFYCYLNNVTTDDYNNLLCFDSGYQNNTPTINITLKNCKDSFKLYGINWDGGHREFLATCFNSSSFYGHVYYLDSSGNEIWTKTTPPNIIYLDSFISDTEICTISLSALNNYIECWDISGTQTYSVSLPIYPLEKNTLGGYNPNTVFADYNNDGYRDVYYSYGILDFHNEELITEQRSNIKIPVDFTKDGSLDQILVFDSYVELWQNSYTNLCPEITQLKWNTGNPICLNSYVTYTISFDDIEEDWGQIAIDIYGNGNYTDFSSLSGFPTLSVQYEQLGTYVSNILLKDSSGNQANVSHGVIIQLENCNSGGVSGSSTTEIIDSDSSSWELFGFVVSDGDIDGYQRDESLYNSTSSTYFDDSRCIEEFGVNWKRDVIPCPFKLAVIDLLDIAKNWVLGSFILVVIALIIFTIYMIWKMKK